LILDVLAPRLREDDRIRAYRFEGYWDDLGSLPDYFRAHQRLLDTPPAPDLHDPGWRIYARSEEMSPALFHAGAEVVDSLVSNGALIEGRIERSVISPGVQVGRGAVVRNSILLGGTVIGAGSVIERAILDKEVRVGEETRIGAGGDAPLTTVGKWAELPAASRIEAGTTVPGAPPRADAALRTWIR